MVSHEEEKLDSLVKTGKTAVVEQPALEVNNKYYLSSHNFYGYDR